MRMRASFPLLQASAAAFIVSLASPAIVSAQGPTPAPSGPCELQVAARELAAPPRVGSYQQPSGEYNTFVGGGAVWTCPAQGMTLVSDSAEYYGDLRVLTLIGRVRYEEPRVRLTSNRLTYRQNEEYLRAEGNVDAVLPSGTSLRGPVTDYWRPIAATRPLSRMVATGRPTIQFVQTPGGQAQPGEPVTIVANNVTMVGDSLVYASGRVDITRTDAVARADSAFMDGGRDYARLMRQPSIQGRGDRPFTLTGNVIDLFGEERLLRRVISSGAARAVSEDVTVSSDTLDMRLANQRLEESFAWGPGRARVVAPTYEMIADSLHVLMPDQRIREVRALRGARAESAPDTSRLRTTQRDWLRGDTIIALFDTVATAERTNGTGEDARIRELTATGGARSYYQLAARDTGIVEPSVNYVRGDLILVEFRQGEVGRVTVTGQSEGLYLEPGATAPVNRTQPPQPAQQPQPVARP